MFNKEAFHFCFSKSILDAWKKFNLSNEPKKYAVGMTDLDNDNKKYTTKKKATPSSLSADIPKENPGLVN